MNSRLTSRWSALVAELGSRRLALLYLVHRVLQRISGGRAGVVPYALVAQPVGNPALAGVRPDPSTVVRRIDRDDPVIAEFPRPRSIIEQRFADGAECHVAWVKGRFAGYIWIARGRYVEDEVRCIYEIADPAGVWDYDVYVDPALRLGRTLARLWKCVDDSLAARGVSRSYSRINRFNAASARSHQRLGAQVLRSVCFLKLGALEIAFDRPWRARMSFGTGGGPRVQLTASGRGDHA